MRNLLFLSMLTFCSASFGQSHEFGTLNFSLGYDAGAHGVLYNSKFDNGTVSFEQDEDTSAAVTSMFRFDGHFNVLKFLSVGLHYRGGKYIEDPDNTAAKGNNVSMLGLGVRLYPVNKDKFVWYVGGTFGLSRLTMNREIVFVTTIPYQYKFKSPHIGFESGFNWYFAGGFGMNFGLGYSTQKFKMTDYSVDGDAQDLTNYENILSSKGVQVNIGLTYHFGGK